MAIGPYPDFSWSHSRDATLQWCERKYYFQYYGKWNGWSYKADKRTQTTYMLTQRTSLQAWAGSIVHEAISRFLHTRPQPQLWLEEVRQKMRHQFVTSRKKTFLAPKKAKSFGLEEHFYDVPLPDEKVRGVWEKVYRCLTAFHESNWPAKIAEAQMAQRYVYIEPQVSNFFEMQVLDHDFGDFAIYAQPDLVYEDEEGILHLVDWKTGTPPQMRHRHEIPPQLAFYLMWLRIKGDQAAHWPLEKMRLTEAYLPQMSIYGGTPQSDTWPKAHQRAVKSIALMQSKLEDIQKNIAAEDAFHLTSDKGKCPHCVFRAVCPGMSDSIKADTA